MALDLTMRAGEGKLCGERDGLHHFVVPVFVANPSPQHVSAMV
jgi:hypothetical protein